MAPHRGSLVVYPSTEFPLASVERRGRLSSLLRYPGGRLDRVAKLRKDEDWVSAAFVGDDARTVLICNDQHLITRSRSGGESARAGTLPMSIVRDRLRPGSLSWGWVGVGGWALVGAVGVPA